MHHDHQAKIGSTQVVCLAKPPTPTKASKVSSQSNATTAGTSKYSSNHPNLQPTDIANGEIGSTDRVNPQLDG